MLSPSAAATPLTGQQYADGSRQSSHWALLYIYRHPKPLAWVQSPTVSTSRRPAARTDQVPWKLVANLGVP